MQDTKQSFFITKEMQMAEVILRNENLLHIIRRFGISLGFNDKTVEELSVEYKLHLDLLVLVLNLFNDKTLQVMNRSRISMIPDLVRYLKKGHEYYITEKIPFIQMLIEKFVEKSEHTHATMLLTFFEEYRKELQEHIAFEESQVYPYIIKLVDTDKEELDSNFRISDFEDHHTDIEEKLLELKMLLIKHFPATEHGMFYRDAIIIELFNLEYDLADHTKLEDEILVPLVQTLEEGKHGS